MANEEHVNILRQGVVAWNAWRDQNENVVPDLSEAELRGEILHKVNLNRAILCRTDLLASDLVDANLHDADLSEAQLSRANMSGANLTGAKLCRTSLGRTNLRNADLSGANLSEAILGGTTLHGCTLLNTNFSNAQIGEVDFCNLDLTAAMNLDSVRPFALSDIGFLTFVRSRAKPISRYFLAACGVPNSMASYIEDCANPQDSLMRRNSCFLSHAVKDEEFVSRLYRGLRDAGVKCWYAPEDLKIGDEFREAIHLSIERNDKLLLVLSENSIRSDWVEEEVNKALAEEQKRTKGLDKEERAKRLVLFPIAIDDSVFECDDIPWVFNLKQKRHIGDFRGGVDFEVAMKRLLRDLNAEAL